MSSSSSSVVLTVAGRHAGSLHRPPVPAARTGSPWPSAGTTRLSSSTGAGTYRLRIHHTQLLWDSRPLFTYKQANLFHTSIHENTNMLWTPMHAMQLSSGIYMWVVVRRLNIHKSLSQGNTSIKSDSQNFGDWYILNNKFNWWYFYIFELLDARPLK